MNLHEVIQRAPTPKPWSEGDKIPWDEPGFSARMLREHLSQEHDQASRRLSKVDAHVQWIHSEVLGASPARVLDLGCGPGLYCHRLACLGHDCVGIDFSPASIAYAAAFAADQPADLRQRCTYRLEDLRKADFGLAPVGVSAGFGSAGNGAGRDPAGSANPGAGFDLVMLIFGEFNTFRRQEGADILRRAVAALRPGGQLVLELEHLENLQRAGRQGPRWFSARAGLFSEKPHICLSESFWDEQDQICTERYFVIDASNGAAARYIQTSLAYRSEQVSELIAACGLERLRFFPSLLGEEDPEQPGFFVVTAQKPGAGPV